MLDLMTTKVYIINKGVISAVRSQWSHSNQWMHCGHCIRSQIVAYAFEKSHGSGHVSAQPLLPPLSFQCFCLPLLVRCFHVKMASFAPCKYSSRLDSKEFGHSTRS